MRFREVVGMSALAFGNWSQHIFVNPEVGLCGSSICFFWLKLNKRLIKFVKLCEFNCTLIKKLTYRWDLSLTWFFVVYLSQNCAMSSYKTRIP